MGHGPFHGYRQVCRMEYKYNAFISYHHTELDTRVAEHIHESLEHYHFTKSVRKLTGFKGKLHIFRDKYNLPVTDSLNDTIAAALRESEYLIVICSDSTSDSVWVEKEIELFLRTHSRKNIFTVLTEGEPYDVIPKLLLYEEKEEQTESGETVIIRRNLEPLSADYRGGIRTARKTELPRLVAGLIKCSYEDLMQRQRQYRYRMIAIAAALLLSLAALSGAYIVHTSTEIRQNYEKALYNRSEYLSEESILAGEEGKNRDLAVQLALAALPDGDNDMPYNPKAHFAVFNALGAYRYPYHKNYTGIHSYEGDSLESFHAIAASRDGRYLAALSEKKYLYLWDTSTRKLLAKEPLNYSYAHFSLEFRGAKLWAYSNEGIIVYNPETLSAEYTLNSCDDSFYITGFDSTDTSIFTLNTKYGTTVPDSLTIRKYDTTAAGITAEIPLDINIKYVWEFKVSSDNRHGLIIGGDSASDKQPRYLAVDLDSGKCSEKDFFKDLKENTSPENACLIDHYLIFTCGLTHAAGEPDAPDPAAAAEAKHTYSKTVTYVMCYDLDKDEYTWRIKVPKGNSYADTRMQYRYIKEIISGQYRRVLLLLSGGTVIFLDPENGDILQKETLPYSNLIFADDSSFEKSDQIDLYSARDQCIIYLYYDSVDTEVFYKEKPYTKPNLTYLAYNSDTDEEMFACHTDEIIHYKRGVGDEAYTWLDEEGFEHAVTDQISSDRYLAVEVWREYSDESRDLIVYDLEKKERIDTRTIDEHFVFLGTLKGSFILEAGTGIYYIYDPGNKTLEKIELDPGKFKEIPGTPKITESKIIDNSIYAVISTTDDQGEVLLYLAEYSPQNKAQGFTMDDRVINLPSPGKSRVHYTCLNEDASKMYVELFDKSRFIISIESGKYIPLNGIDGFGISLIWAGNYLGLYDGSALAVLRSDSGEKILDAKMDNMISFAFDGDDVYWLNEAAEVTRYSLIDGRKETAMLSKQDKYLDFNLKQQSDFNLITKSDWYFDEQTIRVCSRDLLLELDRASLDMIGFCDNLCAYSKDMHKYCVTVRDTDAQSSPGQIKLCLYDTYSLDDLIKKGKKITNDIDLSKHNRMRYGLQ